jgi:tyramine---L-glutamate ligase
MPRIFVYEVLSGGPAEAPPAAEAAPSPAALDELLPQGVAMRDAMLADLCVLPGWQISAAVGPSPGAALGPLPALATGTSLTTAQAHRGETAVDFLRRQARSHEVCWVVAPETGGLLSALQAVVPPAAWLGCDAAALAIASHKSATLAALARHGIATPLAFNEGARRWVAKPDDGAGAVDTRVFAERAAAEAFAERHRTQGQAMTVEPHVPGEVLSISVMAGEGWVQALAFNRQHISESPEGWLGFHGVELQALDARSDPRALRLHVLAMEVARAVPGLLGFVGIDLVWHAERGPVVIEVNPRVTSAYVGLSQRLGRNLADESLRALSTALGRHG